MSNEIVIHVTGKDSTGKVFAEVEKNASGLGASLQKVGTIAGGFLAANVISGGVQKLTGFIGDSIGAIRESIQVNAQLDAVLKSTGGVAGVTATRIREMAGALEKVSLFEDEAIISSSSLLLTFTRIGKNVFPQAQQAILDVAQAMGQDLQGATIMVGKALNDPIAGLAAMSRVGIQFTDDQKKMITGMVEAGDVAGAQAIILAELETQFGGSAKAASDAAGAAEKYKDRMNDLKEQIGEKLLPIQLKWQELQATIVAFIADKIIPVIESFIKYIRFTWQEGDHMNDWLSHLPGPLQVVALKMGELTVFIRDKLIPAFNDVVAFISAHWPEISAVIQFGVDFVRAKIEGMIQQIQGIIAIVTGVVDLVVDLFHGRWAQAWEDMKQIAGGIIDLLIGQIKTAFGSIPGIVLGLVEKAAGAGLDLGRALANGVISGINSLLNRLSGSTLIPAITAPVLGEITPAVKIPELGTIPYLAQGMPYVPEDMLAYLHRGERVVPAAENREQGGGQVQVNIYLDSELIISRVERRQAGALQLAARGG